MKTFLMILGILGILALSVNVNAGSLERQVTGLSILGVPVATAKIVRMGTDSENFVICDLYDKDGNLLAHDAFFKFTDGLTRGGEKNIPFDDVNIGETKYLSGQNPAETWEILTIKLWMSDRQVKDEQGSIVANDPYAYGEKDTKEALLTKINAEKTAGQSLED